MARILSDDYMEALSLSQSENPDKTWNLDSLSEQDRYLEGLDALKQAVRLMLETPRYAHLVYSFDYGCELANLLGQSNDLIETEGKRLIQEALLEDDRILAVENFVFDFGSDEIRVSFEVRSEFGSFSSGTVIG